MPIPIDSLAKMLLDPRGRHCNDQSAAREHNVDRFGDRLPPGLELQWLGTAGFRLGYQGHEILIDPYFTRSNLRGTLGRRALRVDEAEVERAVPAASAVLVGHTHFDHVLDVPVIARRRGCKVYGSSSLANLMRWYGLAEQAIEVQVQHTYEVGPFEIRFVPSLHSKLVLGWKVPFEGELSCEHFDQLRGSHYRCGEVYGVHIRVAGVSFYHQGSANLIDDAIEDRGVDYFLCGIAGRGFTREYVARVLSRLEPRVVVPNHYDDFFRPLSAEMGFSLNVNLGGFIDEVRAVSSDFTVRALRPLQTWGVPTSPGK
jgi:L-ascorbate metabolism protein UlaG (beta-lactamase superfamily)